MIVPTIQSAFNQTVKPYLVVVVDDCSTDNSVQNIKEAFSLTQLNDHLFGNGKLFLFINLKNSGPSTCRNTAIDFALSQADVDSVCILDGDDLMVTTKLERCQPYLDNFSVIYTDYIIENLKTGVKTLEYKRAYSFDKLLQSCIVHSAALITREALEAVKDANGFYDTRLKGPEDYDLWLRIGKRFLMYHLPEVLSIVRYTGKNISDTSIVENQKNYEEAFKIINEKMKNG